MRTRVGRPLSLPASAGLVTAGDFHPCADRLLVRTYAGLYELARPVGSELTAIFRADPVAVPVADEPRGEAVTYAIDGLHYFASGETVAGGPAALLSKVGAGD